MSNSRQSHEKRDIIVAIVAACALIAVWTVLA